MGLPLLGALALALCALSATASADLQVCSPGSGAGHCNSPRGVAVDFETGDVFVADNGNDRVDVFKENGKTLGSPSSFAVSNPVWIAVDNDPASPSHHDLYLSTSEYTAKKFKPNGELLATFGEKGDGTPEGCQLERENDPIAVGPGGVVYLGDSYDKDGEGSGNVRVSRVVKFDASGACIGAAQPFEGANQSIRDLAVDSVGAIYVTVEVPGRAIRKYDSGGSLVKQFEEVETKGLAIDGSDHLFAEQRGERVTKPELDHFFTEYDTSGAIMRRFAYGPAGLSAPPGLAAYHSLDGDLFASNSSVLDTGVKYFSLPLGGPVLFPEACHPKSGGLGSDKATLQAEVNPEGKFTDFKYEYLTQEQFEVEGGFQNAKSSTEETLEGEADFELHEAAQRITGLEPETTYRCRVVAGNADSGAEGTIGEEGSFTTGPPFEFGTAWAADVTTSEVTLNLEGNPKGIPATAQIEYVTDARYRADGFAEAQKAPESELDYGAGEAMVLRSTTLTGLEPATLYHYRLRAKNLNFPEGIVCPQQKPSCPGFEHAFRTFNPGESGLPDERAWEMVSPSDKNSGDVAGTPNGKGFVESRSILVQAAASSGEAVTYTSWTSFGGAGSAPGTSQYLSKRTPDSWQTENISPAGFEANLFVPPYLGFSPDLRFGAVKLTEPSLSPDCPEGHESLYLHEAHSGAFRCLTPEAPNSALQRGYCFVYAGASEDGSRVFFGVNAPYAGAPSGNGSSLYEWHEGQLSVVSVLAGQSEPAAPTPDMAFGARNAESCQTGQTTLHHAISADGTRAIWTYVPSDGTKPSQLLDRVNGTETVQLDAVQSGNASKPGNGLYWAASKDGQVVYFTDENKLISQVKAEAGAPDLYRYDFSKPIGQRLTDLTKGSVPGNVQGVLGASDDGSIVYFVAKAALTPEAEANEAAQHSEAGKNNLYLYDAGEGKTKFVAQLALPTPSDPGDNHDWETQPKVLTARVSPDGGRLAFLSSESQKLVGYDNTLAATSGKFAGGQHCRLSDEAKSPEGGPQCPEAFVYDAESNKLTCASCNPSGARPLGPAIFPGWTNMAEGPRLLSDNGRRLFFESYDRLSHADENDKRDIYEFELAGSGSCTSGDPAFDPASGGCHYLISSGRSEDESFLIDASADGRDAFFSTRDPLVGSDSDRNYDVYDAREGGGFSEPPPLAPSCEGEGCKPPVVAPPGGASPSTPGFQSSGNVAGPGKPRCPKGKHAVRRSGKARCVKPRHDGKRHKRTRR